MHLLKSLALGLFVSLARALPTNTPPVTRFNLIHQHNNLNSRVSTTAWTNDWSRVLGHSCSASLLSGTFEHLPVHFNVDQAGRGSVLLGATSHFLQGSNKSEHVECSGMYGEADPRVHWVLQGLSIVFPPSAIDAKKACDPNRLCYHDHRHRTIDAKAPAVSGLITQYSSKTANLDCADGTCSAEHLESESFTVSFTASASAYGWIDGGFAVEKSVETGLANSCNGGFNERVCV
ncbi:hypothetical protein QBC34DRAFT_379511 [Podospora aff. communis PSN243]|uniref:AA1-like domain-containing protein n=1 Tax=Podospora aff. communis PSN243 TaxID=3040156 RepID=A0AAV9GQU7_9PEZI|nr:hypothetical protein QBC34DRAFT_379511 [Podospora aff. communis PSN243]